MKKSRQLPKVEPLGADEVRALLAPIESEKQVLLAVSGGADSLALLIVTARWAKEKHGVRPRVSVASVDHGLRAEAADEAAMAGRVAANLGLQHVILKWDGEKPTQGIQEAARNTRYRLLSDHAKALGARVILTGHHADDQAETVLLRLAAGSGLSGLAGMASETPLQGDHILFRPFLAISGVRLRATVTAAGLSPIEDPSNVNQRFARPRLRSAADVLSREGLDTARLMRFAERMRRADEALESVVEDAERGLRIPSTSGERFTPGVLSRPAEIGIRLIGVAIRRVSNGAALELNRLEALHAALSDALRAGKSLQRSLAGAIIALDRQGGITVSREPPRRSRLSLGKGTSGA